MKTRFTIITILLAALFTLGTVTYAAPADPPTKKELRKEQKRLKKIEKEKKKEEKRVKKLKMKVEKTTPFGENLDSNEPTEGDAGEAV